MTPYGRSVGGGSAPVEPGHDLDVGGVREQVHQLARRRGRSPPRRGGVASRPRAAGSQLTSTTRAAWVAATLPTAFGAQPGRGRVGDDERRPSSVPSGRRRRGRPARRGPRGSPAHRPPRTPTAPPASPGPRPRACGRTGRRRRRGRRGGRPAASAPSAAPARRRRAPRHRRPAPGRTRWPRCAIDGRPARRGTTRAVRPPAPRALTTRTPSGTSTVSGLAVHDDQPLAGARAGAQHHLAVGVPTVLHELVHQRVGHEARADADDVVAAAAPQTEPPVDRDAAEDGAVAGGRQRRVPRRRRRRRGPAGAARRPPPRP